jgi:hypothetical protein
MPDGNSQRKVYECWWNPGTYSDFRLVVSKAWTSENAYVVFFTADSGFVELAELEILEELDEQNQ